MTSWKFNVSVWLSLFLLAFIFTWERILYADSAFTLFNILNHFPAVEHHRYSQFLNLFPAQTAVYLQLPIHTVATLLSITPLIWAFAASWYATAQFKKPYWNFYFLGIFLITGPEFQFLGTAEMILALIFGGLFTLEIRKPLIFLWAVIAYLAHPGILPALIAVSLFQKPFHLLSLAVAFLFKLALIPASGYESQILEKFFQIQNVFQSWGWHYFYTSIFGGWALPYFVAFISGIVVFQGKTRWLYISTAISLTFLITYLYQEGDSGMMMQKSYAPLWLLLAVPLLYVENNKLIRNIMIGSFFWGCFYLVKQANFHTNRLHELKTKIEIVQNRSKSGQKIITMADEFHPDIFGIAWAIPYETLIYSAHLDGEKPITFCLSDRATLNDLKSNRNKKPLGKNEFRGASFAYPLKNHQLNQRYFSGLSKDAYRIP